MFISYAKKNVTLILVALFTTGLIISCDRTSSPEGRMTIKVEELQKQINDLKEQNKAILDSLGKINQGLEKMKK